MAEYLVKRPLKRPPVHPGEILREDVLKSLDLSEVRQQDDLVFLANNFIGY